MTDLYISMAYATLISDVYNIYAVYMKKVHFCSEYESNMVFQARVLPHVVTKIKQEDNGECITS